MIEKQINEIFFRRKGKFLVKTNKVALLDKEDNTDNEGTKFTFEEYIPNALSNYQQDEVNFNVLLTLQKHFELKIDTKINCEETKKEILFKNIFHLDIFGYQRFIVLITKFFVF